MQKERKATEQRRLEDLTEDLEVVGERQKKLVEEQARLKAEAAVYLVLVLLLYANNKSPS